MTGEWLAWLAGIMDGEGTIGVTLSSNKAAKHALYKPTFQMVNTDMRLINRASDIIEEVCGRRPNLVVSHWPSGTETGNQKVCYRISMITQKRLVVLLPKIIPYLVSKQRQAQILYEFCLRRSLRYTKKWNQFAAEDKAAWMQCLELNRRGKSGRHSRTVESIGGAPAKAGEDVLRPTEESVEAAEMTARQLRLVI